MATDTLLHTIVTDKSLFLCSRICDTVSNAAIDRKEAFARAQESLNLPTHVVSLASEIVEAYAKGNAMPHVFEKRQAIFAASIYIVSNREISTGRTMRVIRDAFQITDNDINQAHTALQQAMKGTVFETLTESHVNPETIINDKIKLLINRSEKGNVFATHEYAIRDKGEPFEMNCACVPRIQLLLLMHCSSEDLQPGEDGEGL